MSAPPYMRLYWGDYSRKTRHLKTAAEHGAYLMLIGALWDNDGRLLADDETLAAHALCTSDEWAALKPKIMPFFRVLRGKIVNDRVNEELAKYRDTSGKRKLAGKAGGAASRRNTTENPQAIAEQKPTKSESESEPKEERSSDLFVVQASPAPPAKLPPAWKRDAEFVALWGLATDQMRKRAKSAAHAHAAWQKARRGGDGSEIVAGMRGYLAKDPDVGRTGGPGLHIWLNNRTFETYAGVDGAAPSTAWPDSRWAMAVELWRDEGSWGESLGPPPGQPGCRVPTHLLVSTSPANPQPVRGVA